MRRRALGIAVALGSAALAALVAWSRREVRRGETAFPPQGRVLELPSGARLHVVEEGDGAPPVVFVHGADGVALSFTETVTAEVARAHRAVALDRPGHGWSTLPPGAVAGVATDVGVIREGMAALGVTRPTVVGHSYGSLVALAWALDRPDEVRALVLLSPVATYPWRLPAWVLRPAGVPLLGRALTETFVVPVGRAVLGPLTRHAFFPQDVPERYREYSRALYARPAQFRALASEYAKLRDDVRSLEPRFGELALPVEIVVGEEDQVTRARLHAERLAREVPAARLTVLPGVGHELMWTRPDAIVDAVRRAEERSR